MRRVMTIPEFLELQRYKKDNKINFKKEQFKLIVSVIGSCLCLGKTISTKLKLNSLIFTFCVANKIFFWFIILCGLLKGLDRISIDRKKGIVQIISSLATIILFFIFKK